MYSPSVLHWRGRSISSAEGVQQGLFSSFGSRSLRCCGSNLSGPPAEPFGKDFIALITRLAGITKPSGREAGGGEVMGVWIEGQKKYCH